MKIDLQLNNDKWSTLEKQITIYKIKNQTKDQSFKSYKSFSHL